MDPTRWNANLHAFDSLLHRIPASARRGIDVGCGEGETARRLRLRVPEVVGVDPHAPSILDARTRSDDVEYIVGDVRTTDLPVRAFDVVTAVAMLHHLDHQQGLQRLAELVRPGGLLLVVGMARSRQPKDHLRDVWDAVAVRRHTWRRKQWHTTAPVVWPPPLTHDQVRARSAEVLPTAEVKRVAYFRYSLTWTAPVQQRR